MEATVPRHARAVPQEREGALLCSHLLNQSKHSRETLEEVAGIIQVTLFVLVLFSNVERNRVPPAVTDEKAAGGRSNQAIRPGNRKEETWVQRNQMV